MRLFSKLRSATTFQELTSYGDLFDADYYRAQVAEIGGLKTSTPEELLTHYLSEGWKLGLDPSAQFGGSHYLDNNPEVRDAGIEPLSHFLKYGREEGRARYPANWTPWQAAIYPKDSPLYSLDPLFDRDFYLAVYTDIRTQNIDPLAHYVGGGWKEGRDPAPWFSTDAFLTDHPDYSKHDCAPLFHLLAADAPTRDEIAPSKVYPVNLEDVSIVKEREHEQSSGAKLQIEDIQLDTDVQPTGRESDRNDHANVAIVETESTKAPSSTGNEREAETGDAWYEYLKSVIEPHFDSAFYAEHYGDTIGGDTHPLDDYLTRGWKLTHDPCPSFSVQDYLTDHPDVRDANIEPFSHYLDQGGTEGRLTKPSRKAQPTSKAGSIYEAHRVSTAPGPDFESPKPEIFAPHRSKAKALAFYLPQFHAFEENNEWWGKGFTEWTKIAHGMPRFAGHRQPRIPRDPGFYDLTDVKNLRAQAKLAKAYGVYGFAIYYYFFNGKRLMEKPLDILLENTDIEMPFCLIWANENWTRTWDGFEDNVLISQDYRAEDEDNLLADWYRHFVDTRYIRIAGRPLIVIYRPGIIPDCAETVARWRKKLKQKYDETPFFVMAQGFGDTDPRKFGMDAALEFPPHKILAGAEPVNNQLEIYDPDFSGTVFEYKTLIERSLSEAAPEYPLIKSATLGWDNEARRPGGGMTVTEFTPALYEHWLSELVNFADTHRIEDEAFVGINAWNEWAEGVYLEPDTYYGHALLNSTARAVSPSINRNKILLVGHDAHKHGAQLLLLNLLRTLKNSYGFEVASLVLGPGELNEAYESLGMHFEVDRNDASTIRAAVKELRKAGYAKAIVNTTVAGFAADILKDFGFSFVSLVHELPTLINDYNLHPAARSISKHADMVVFPGSRVRKGFESITGQIEGAVLERAQGLYESRLLERKSTRSLHQILDVPESSKFVLNMGFGDSRKGFDLFIKTAERMIAERDDVVFVWGGNVTADIQRWILPDLEDRGLSKRIIITGYLSDVGPYYRGAHAFFLSAREDPHPSVILEAMCTGLPLVGFADVGDCEPLIKRHGEVVPRADIDAAVEALNTALDRSSSAKKKAKAAARRHIREKYDFKDYALSLTEALNPKQKRVSVVVPNYNYEDHIEARLASIFEQTYPIYEIIVLDDKSPDDSLARIEAVTKRYNRDIKLVVNKTNSGSVFHQWDKGARLAKGDYVWIAEADDVADSRFLEELMASAAEKDFSIAFTDSWQMDENDAPLSGTYKPYCGAYTDNLFDNKFRMNGSDFLRDCLSIRNVILNVSSAVWNKATLVEALDNVGKSLLDFRVAGDWRLYVEVCKSAASDIVYVPEALNGHRRHSTSVTHALDVDQHLAEIVEMQKLAASLVELPDTIKNRQTRAMDEVKAHFERLLEDNA